MTARRACIRGILAAIVPLWVGTCVLGGAWVPPEGWLWPLLLGAVYCLSVFATGGLCAYAVRLRELGIVMAAVHGPVPGRKAVRR